MARRRLSYCLQQDGPLGKLLGVVSRNVGRSAQASGEICSKSRHRQIRFTAIPVYFTTCRARTQVLMSSRGPQRNSKLSERRSRLGSSPLTSIRFDVTSYSRRAMSATHSRSSSLDQDGDSILTDSEAAPLASTSALANASPAQALLQPSGPICAYGSRLAYTYFPTPAPRAEVLNQLQQEVHFFSVDDQLVYLSFFQDSGPLNAACL